MDYAGRALAARRIGAEEDARALFALAFEREAAAADFFATEYRTEPTRSVLYRSAASLALDHGNYRAAERLLAAALMGDPPDPIAGEVRDLMEMVHFQRHWDLRGVQLEPDEFQFSMEGEGVGFGIAPAGQFVGRVRDVETLIYRTAERKLSRPFREGGRRQKALDESLQLFVSVPRAASFAVTFKIGATRDLGQLEIPGMEIAQFPAVVVREVLDGIELVNRRELSILEGRIADETYFRNFVGLAQKIAPDGDIVKSVGFTAVREGVERRVALTTPKKDIQPPLRPEVPMLPGTRELVEVQGILLEADAKDSKSGHIELLTAEGRTEVVIVPRGMMRDIVRPLFEEEVVVVGTRVAGRRIELHSVRPANE